MTDTGLAEAWAKMMGWKTEILGKNDVWYHVNESSMIPARNWHPLTSWSDWGICYEWMIGRGWRSCHSYRNNCHIWTWFHPGNKDLGHYHESDPDIRRAMLLAALKAKGENETD